jgi:hypothetical protein
MDKDLGPGMAFECRKIDFGIEGHPPSEFFLRNPVSCASYLLRQRAYKDCLSYEPIQQFADENCRVYSEMHTGNWWWDQQVCIKFKT